MRVSDRILAELRNALPRTERGNVDVRGAQILIKATRSDYWTTSWNIVCNMKGNSITQIISKTRKALTDQHRKAIEDLEEN